MFSIFEKQLFLSFFRIFRRLIICRQCFRCTYLLNGLSMLLTWRGHQQSQKRYVIRVQSSCNSSEEISGPLVCKCVADILGNRMIGPYLLPELLTGHSYLVFLRDILTDYLEIHGLWVQNDVAPAHFSSPVSYWLDMEFPGHCIGRFYGGQDCQIWHFWNSSNGQSGGIDLWRPSYYRKWLSYSCSYSVYFCRHRTAATCAVSHSTVRACMLRCAWWTFWTSFYVSICKYRCSYVPYSFFFFAPRG